MSSGDSYGQAILEFLEDSTQLSQELNSIATSKFSCDGIEEFALEEIEVDHLLGERAYSGGDLPDGVLDEIEDACNKKRNKFYSYYFHSDNFKERMNLFCEEVRKIYPNIKCTCTIKSTEDWNAEWKKFYNPIQVSANLEIVPEWLQESYSPQAKNTIYIYPGMGFGTGSHETTFLCLKLFDVVSASLKDQERCLDFGCGSGILGIAAISILKMKVTFCDIDKKALDNTLKNITLNFSGMDLSGTELVLRERLNHSRYELIFANILENILIFEKEIILSSLRENGFLIISGILNSQVENIISEYSILQLIKVESKGDWSAILLQDKTK